MIQKVLESQSVRLQNLHNPPNLREDNTMHSLGLAYVLNLMQLFAQWQIYWLRYSYIYIMKIDERFEQIHTL